MSTENQWSGIIQEFAARGIACLPDTSGDPEPWLSYAAIAALTGQAVTTVEDKCAGLRRHPFGGMIKLSDLEKKLLGNGKKKTPRKTQRKRPPSRN